MMNFLKRAIVLLLLAGQAFAQSGTVDRVFIQSGTGAVSRTLLDRAKDWVSVKDFGAKCDGVTNDSAAFQRAIDAYKNVLVPAGTCIIDAPLHVLSDLSIKGEKRKTILKKTTATAETITRTYVDTAGATQTSTWSDPVVFNLVHPNNSYLVDFQIDGITFDLPADASVGVFNAKRIAYSSFRNLFVNTSAYFIKAYDIFQIDFAQIRTRYSKDHFNIDTGTSNTFTNVAVDGKYSTGGNGYTFKNLSYTTMVSASADSVDRAYYFDNSTVTMNGCGAETFSRILHIVNGSNVAINGGMLAVYKSASATGTYYPYVVDGAGTSVAITGTWLGIKNSGSAGGTYAQFDVQAGAQLTLNSVRYPVELNGGVADWWYVIGSGSVLNLVDKNGARFINSSGGVSRLDGLNSIKSFEYTKTSIPAATWSSVFRIANGSYGQSAFGRIRVYFFNPYTPDAGYVGYHEYMFTAANESTKSQTLVKLGGTETQFNTNFATAPTFNTPLAQVVRNGDNTIDFQVYTPTNYGASTVTVVVEYMGLTGATHGAGVMTGL
jgi:hypothetical protein